MACTRYFLSISVNFTLDKTGSCMTAHCVRITNVSVKIFKSTIKTVCFYYSFVLLQVLSPPPVVVSCIWWLDCDGGQRVLQSGEDGGQFYRQAPQMLQHGNGRGTNLVTGICTVLLDLYSCFFKIWLIHRLSSYEYNVPRKVIFECFTIIFNLLFQGLYRYRTC